MSIVVLKKKSNRYKSVVSGKGVGGFSINGGRRNQGWVGQDTLGRHLNGTPFRGLEPMGNGGTGGKYVKSIVNSGGCCTNDPNIIKRSSINTRGYIDATVTHPTAVYNAGCTNICSQKWVQNFSPLDHSQSSHIKQLKVKTAQSCNAQELDLDLDLDRDHKDKKQDLDRDHKDKKQDLDLALGQDHKEKKKCGCDNKKLFYINGKRFYIVNNTKRKNKVHIGAVSSGEYTDFGALHSRCLPPPPNKKPFPMNLLHGGCDVNYLTPEAAIEGGALPDDWMLN
jgi:hypothetical protein